MAKHSSLATPPLPAGLSAGGLVFEVVCAAGQDGARVPPDWVQLAPRGRVTARDGRVFVFDPERLVAAHAAGGIDLPLDFDHETEMAMMLGTKPARGWITALEARPEGLFGKIDWLPDAVAALAARAYRYISPTFWRDEDGITARLLKGAALVTSPALGMPAVASATQDHPMLQDLLRALGLPETATAPEATAAIAALRTPDPAAFVPKAQYDQTVTALSAAQAEIQAGRDAAIAARCEALVGEAVKAGKIAPAAKDHFIALARASFDETKAAIAAMPVLIKPGQELAGAVDPSAAGAGLSDPERLIARQLGVSDEDFLKSRAA